MSQPTTRSKSESKLIYSVEDAWQLFHIGRGEGRREGHEDGFQKGWDERDQLVRSQREEMELTQLRKNLGLVTDTVIGALTKLDEAGAPRYNVVMRIEDQFIFDIAIAVDAEHFSSESNQELYGEIWKLADLATAPPFYMTIAFIPAESSDDVNYEMLASDGYIFHLKNERKSDS